MSMVSGQDKDPLAWELGDAITVSLDGDGDGDAPTGDEPAGDEPADDD